MFASVIEANSRSAPDLDSPKLFCGVHFTVPMCLAAAGMPYGPGIRDTRRGGRRGHTPPKYRLPPARSYQIRTAP